MTQIQTNKILFAGDPHGKFSQINDAAIEYKPEAIILLGDCCADKPIDEYLQLALEETAIYWIQGNHDFSSKIYFKNLFNSALAEDSLHLKVLEVAGLRIAGLGGVFSGKMWYPPESPKFCSLEEFLKTQPSNIRKQGGNLKHKSAIFYDDIEKLKQFKADILVTHEAPSSHRYGFKMLDELAKKMGVKKIIHGHHHKYYKSTINNEIEVFGVNKAEIINLTGDVLNLTKGVEINE